jgi:hypothetical protein
VLPAESKQFEAENQPMVKSAANPRRIADQPHSYTVWLAFAALLVSTASALFSGLQWIQARAERNKPPALRVIERPRLSFESATQGKILVAGEGWSFQPGLPPQPVPQRDEHYLEFTLRFENTGRSTALVTVSAHGSVLGSAWHASSGSKSAVPPFELSKAPTCLPEGQTDWKMPPIPVSVNQPVELSVSAGPVTKADLKAVIAGDKQMILCGIVSYEDSFHETLKTVWQGTTLPGGKNTIGLAVVYVGYVP